jgi:flavin-binding protein dodecin
VAVARVTPITASSPTSFEAAIAEGLKRANKTLRGMTGLEVVSQKAKIENGKITEYRVTFHLTFVLE